MKNPNRFYCLMLFILCCNSSPAVIIPDTHLILGGAGSSGSDSYDYSLSVSQNTTNTDTTAILFNLDQGNLTFVNTLVDEGSDWYVASEDDIFQAANINSGLFTTFVQRRSGQSPITNTINLSIGDFFLAVNTGDSTDSHNIFGWVKLNYNGTSLTYLDSAVAYGELGIMVGANQAVPEPGTYALLVGGATLAFATLRRRRRKVGA